MKAMILAAGRGERLKPLTQACPKPLIKVQGKPLIVYHLEALKRAGIDEVVINVCTMADQIMAVLKEGQDWGLTIRYSIEDNLLGTGGGVRKALPLLGADPFLLINGDVFTDYPFETLKNKTTKQAHLVLVPNPDHHPEGDYALEKQAIKRRHQAKTVYTYSGISVLNPTLFQSAQSEAFPLPSLLNQAIYGDQMTGEVYEGFWSDVGTVDRLKALELSLQINRQQKKA